ncbi:phosphoserine phosphatase SerB [Celerinatantimonas diazotrophica]|uniref:phosphoserine phosphatase SerB n=1 Tax=Celerinatantimonas diazotrophica TaxID=412034 RepID=UPI001CC6E1ED|nr:phosphoserine phosphatase SerB [Celerinatantimonas diazotrophica]
MPVSIAADGQITQQAIRHSSTDTTIIGWSKNESDIKQLVANLYQEHECWRIYPAMSILATHIFVLTTPIAEPLVKERIERANLDFDIVAMTHIPNLNQPGMLVMDMDSTTIQVECIDEIAKLAGVGEQVSAVTARAMRGELDFSQSLRSRVALLKDAPVAILDDVKDNLPLMPGVQVLLSHLQVNGWKVILASGGFTYFAKALQQRLGFDAVFANELGLKDGVLTGEVVGDIVDAQYKVNVLKRMCQQFQIEPTQTMAIGDGANDLAMLSESSLGVALHAKPIVQQQAKIAINYSNLEGLLFVLMGGVIRDHVACHH